MALPEGQEWRLPDAYRNSPCLVLCRLSKTATEILGEDPLPPLPPRRASHKHTVSDASTFKKLSSCKSSGHESKCKLSDIDNGTRRKKLKQPGACRNSPNLVLRRLSKTATETLGEDPLPPLPPRRASHNRTVSDTSTLKKLSSWESSGHESKCKLSNVDNGTRRQKLEQPDACRNSPDLVLRRLSKTATEILGEDPLPPLPPRRASHKRTCSDASTFVTLSSRESPGHDSEWEHSDVDTGTQRKKRKLILRANAPIAKENVVDNAEVAAKRSPPRKSEEPVTLPLPTESEYEVDEDGFLIEPPPRARLSRKRSAPCNQKRTEDRKRPKLEAGASSARNGLDAKQRDGGHSAVWRKERKPMGDRRPSAERQNSFGAKWSNGSVAEETSKAKPKGKLMLRSVKVPEDLRNRWEREGYGREEQQKCSPKSAQTSKSRSLEGLQDLRRRRESDSSRQAKEMQSAPKRKLAPMLRSVPVPEHLRRRWQRDGYDGRTVPSSPGKRMHGPCRNRGTTHPTR